MQIKKIKTKQELSEAVNIYIEVFSQPPWNETWNIEHATKKISEYIESHKETCFIVKETEVVGLVLGQIEIEHYGKKIYVDDFIVKPSRQKAGIGKMMLQELLNIAKKHNLQKICLDTIEDGDAYQYWIKNGFKKDGMVLMEKIL